MSTPEGALHDSLDFTGSRATSFFHHDSSLAVAECRGIPKETIQIVVSMVMDEPSVMCIRLVFPCHYVLQVS
jgi:hypothetical protein